MTELIKSVESNVYSFIEFVGYKIGELLKKPS